MKLAMERRASRVVIAAAMLTVIVSANANADMTYGFGAISANSVSDPAIGEAQLFVTVSEYASNQILFSFFNSGPLASSIADVYFDDSDGVLLGIASLIDSDDGVGGDPGVDFSQGANPGNLPGGASVDPGFEVTAGFLASADNPPVHRGVNPDEWLGIVFDLNSGGTLVDVLDELSTGELRIGVHVQGFADGGSESFISHPTPVPAPGAALLAALGLGLVGWMKKRFV